MTDQETMLLGCEAALDQTLASVSEQRQTGTCSVYDIYRQLMTTRPAGEDDLTAAVFMIALCIDRLVGDPSRR